MLTGEYGTKTAELFIEGMTCGRCVQKIENALTKIDGIEYYDVIVGHVRVSYMPHILTVNTIMAAIEEGGYVAQTQMPQKSRWKRFIDRMVESNEKTFGTNKLDCCTMTSDQEKRTKYQKLK